MDVKNLEIAIKVKEKLRKINLTLGAIEDSSKILRLYINQKGNGSIHECSVRTKKLAIKLEIADLKHEKQLLVNKLKEL